MTPRRKRELIDSFKNNLDELVSIAYDEGYDEGCEDGYGEGFEDGKAEGSND